VFFFFFGTTSLTFCFKPLLTLWSRTLSLASEASAEYYVTTMSMMLSVARWLALAFPAWTNSMVWFVTTAKRPGGLTLLPWNYGCSAIHMGRFTVVDSIYPTECHHRGQCGRDCNC